VRLVSMPCTEAFDAQPTPYRESVLPSSVTRRLAIEAGATQSWWRYVGSQGASWNRKFRSVGQGRSSSSILV